MLKTYQPACHRIHPQSSSQDCFVVFEFGFIVACMLFAQPVLQIVAWPAVLVGNLLAAAAMAATLWRWHPHLRILP